MDFIKLERKIYRYMGNKDNSHLIGTDTDIDSMYYLQHFKGQLCYINDIYKCEGGDIVETFFYDKYDKKRVELRFSFNSPYTIIEPKFKPMTIHSLILRKYIHKKRVKSFKEILYLCPHPFSLLPKEVLTNICHFLKK